MENFIERLELMLDYYALSASAFADKIGVQRSSLSHLLSGRNKPSLDFILKIVEVFPEVDLYWIINGVGTFPKSTKNETINLFNSQNQNPNTTAPILNKLDSGFKTARTNQGSELENEASLFSIHQKNEFEETAHNQNEFIQQVVNTKLHDDKIDKIVFFYRNGQFEVFHPK